MHRGLLHLGVWALTTAAAVTLSWFGVRAVLRGTAYDPPRAVPVAAAGGAGAGVASSTQRPSPPPSVPASASASSSTSASTSASASAPASRVTRKAGAPRATGSPKAADDGEVRGYNVAGGRVVLDLGASAATLVSATPNSGWTMRVWTQEGWLRVTFTVASGEAASTVICTWNGHAPQVQSYEN